MVSIHNYLQEISSAMKPGQAGTTRGHGIPGAFESVLNQTLDPSDPAHKSSGVLPELSEIPTVSALESKLQSRLISGTTEKLLGLLDGYASQLEDPAVPLSGLTPFLEQMNQTAGDLLKEIEFLDTDNLSLKDIATQTALAARTEYIKFQRGDYLA